ncbi:MAG: radical SAM protein [Prevotellaceae bacterium]|nr:radical SAM protein [Prevotellaceae bacterium]
MNTILLISANRYKNPYPVYPIGISYLKTYIKRMLPDYDVCLFDFNREDYSSLKLVIEEQNPRYIGVSLRNIDGANSFDRSSFIPGYKEILDEIRSSTSVPVVIGGAGFSVYPQLLFDELNPDFAIIGEGEQSWVNLVRILDAGKDYSSVEGLVFRDGSGKIKVNEHVNYLKNLEVEFEDGLIDYYWTHSGMLNIQTKRGCCYHCIYCSYPIIDGRKIRTLNADLIVDNLLRLNREKGVRYVFFTDSVFNICPEYNRELAEKIISSGLKISWGAYFSPNNITDEEMALFKRSGLTHIEFGTESLCDVQLKNYGKHFTFEDVKKASDIALKNNVFYAHFLILGGYGETDETIMETMENSKKLNYTVYFPFVGMRIYPRTRLQKIAIEEGVISKDDLLLNPTYYISKNFDMQKMRSLARATGKAWSFPDDPHDPSMDLIRLKRKGLIWEFLRKP